jgi:type I restriction enzyme S subunit
MNSKWQLVRLGDIVTVKHGYAFEGEYFGDTPSDDILLTPGNFAIGGGFKSDKLKYYTGFVPQEFVLAPGDLIVTMTDLSKESDTLGYPALVPDSTGVRYLHNQRLGKVIIQDENRASRDFLYHLLCTREYRNEILASASGSVIKHTSPDRICAFKFMLPPLPEQRAIAHILGTLDDKIELNRKMNETLEAIARALFKSWFVDFDPVRAKMEGRQPAGMDAETAALFPDAFEDSELGRIPKGWGVQRLEQHLDAEKGLSYSGSGLSETSGVPMHNLNSVYEGGGYKFEGIKFYTGEFRERHVLHPGDVIVANTEQGFDYLLIGYPAIVPKHFGNTGIFSHHIFRVRPVPGSPLTTRFIHYLLMVPLVREQVVACTNGTTVNMLSVDGLRTPRFVLSSVELIQRFESIAAPVFAKAEGNYEQSLSLAALRDALLPKLISGEVRVKDAGKFVVEML